MMRIAIISLVLMLAACQSISDYQPYIQDVVDPVALTHDEADCLKYAQAWKEPFDIGNVGQQAAEGAASNAAGAAVNPLVPVLGAAGNASVAILQGVGVLNTKQRTVFLKCLEHRGERSRAYDVMDPNE